MKLEILSVYENLDEYLLEMEKENADCEALWNKYAIEPYWEKISHYAPFDMSDRKPKPIKNIGKLKEQIKLMKEINLDMLKSKFEEVTNALPNYDDDPLTIAIYPIDDDNLIVKEQQNGVLGVCIFGNMVLNVNPLAENYLDWIPYVFAHEYHHTVWGNYWMVVHGGRTGTFLESLLIDGQADAFAASLNPALKKPTWLSQISKEQEKELWNNHYSKLLYKTNYDYEKYMFGDGEAGIPWCAGYFFGHEIIDSFRKVHPQIDFKTLLEMSSEEIYAISDYNN